MRVSWVRTECERARARPSGPSHRGRVLLCVVRELLGRRGLAEEDREGVQNVVAAGALEAALRHEALLHRYRCFRRHRDSVCTELFRSAREVRSAVSVYGRRQEMYRSPPIKAHAMPRLGPNRPARSVQASERPVGATMKKQKNKSGYNGTLARSASRRSQLGSYVWKINRAHGHQATLADTARRGMVVYATDLLERIAEKAALVARRDKVETIKSRHVIGALGLVYGGELRRNAVSEAARSCAKHAQHAQLSV